MRLTPGLRLGPYEVLSVLGTGGMAEVYRARDTRLGRDIALKVVSEVLAPDGELLRRFEQEARVAGSLNHPNLVAVYDVGQHEGVPFFVTELLQGESLRHRLSRGRLPVQTALEWAAQTARGLAAAHGRGIVHRDVKPDNLFVSSDGQVKLLDFGIAKLAASAQDGSHGLMDVTVTPTAGLESGGAKRAGLCRRGRSADPAHLVGLDQCPRRDLRGPQGPLLGAVSYTHLRAHETPEHLVC